jgi:hypothetical protein
LTSTRDQQQQQQKQQQQQQQQQLQQLQQHQLLQQRQWRQKALVLAVTTHASSRWKSSNPGGFSVLFSPVRVF